VTATYRVGETGELIRSSSTTWSPSRRRTGHPRGRRRVGESFPLTSDRMTIGRRPGRDIFLDDVLSPATTPLLVRRGDEIHITTSARSTART